MVQCVLRLSRRSSAQVIVIANAAGMAFDDDPGIRPQFHTFVEDDRAAWDKIADDLPQYPGPLP